MIILKNRRILEKRGCWKNNQCKNRKSLPKVFYASLQVLCINELSNLKGTT